MVVGPAIASAQGYYGNAMDPGGFHHRANRLVYGGSIGLGVMNDSGDRITCNNCNTNPVAFEADGHIGGMLNSRLALLFEVQINGQLISADTGTGPGDQTLVQSAAMLAIQYWLTPQFWIKGGAGLSNLHIDSAYYGDAPGSDGFAIMGAAGFEIFSARRMAIELQGRVISGSYDGVSDHITAGTIGIGINWF
jgi:hypothetical protein